MTVLNVVVRQDLVLLLWPASDESCALLAKVVSPAEQDSSSCPSTAQTLEGVMHLRDRVGVTCTSLSEITV
jgi:hypothetical protein